MKNRMCSIEAIWKLLWIAKSLKSNIYEGAREGRREKKNSRRKIEQGFVAKRSSRAVESVANCTGPMLTRRVAQRRVVSVKSARFIPLCPHIVPYNAYRFGRRSSVTFPADGECIMLGMPEFPSSSLRILSRSCRMVRGEQGWLGGGRRTRKEAREAPSVQNLREFVTPSRDTLVHVVEEIAKFPTGLLRHVSIPQRGCFPPTSFVPTPCPLPPAPVVRYAKILANVR